MYRLFQTENPLHYFVHIFIIVTIPFILYLFCNNHYIFITHFPSLHEELFEMYSKRQMVLWHFLVIANRIVFLVLLSSLFLLLVEHARDFVKFSFFFFTSLFCILLCCTEFITHPMCFSSAYYHIYYTPQCAHVKTVYYFTQMLWYTDGTFFHALLFISALCCGMKSNSIHFILLLLCLKGIVKTALHGHTSE